MRINEKNRLKMNLQLQKGNNVVQFRTFQFNREEDGKQYFNIMRDGNWQVREFRGSEKY